MSDSGPTLQVNSTKCGAWTTKIAQYHTFYRGKYQQYFQFAEMVRTETYLLPSWVTQRDIVWAGTAESSHRRFITSCLSRGPNKLQYEHFRLVRARNISSKRIPPTETLRDMMKVFGTTLSACSVTGSAEKRAKRAPPLPLVPAQAVQLASKDNDEQDVQRRDVFERGPPGCTVLDFARLSLTDRFDVASPPFTTPREALTGISHQQRPGVSHSQRVASRVSVTLH